MDEPRTPRTLCRTTVHLPKAPAGVLVLVNLEDSYIKDMLDAGYIVPVEATPNTPLGDAESAQDAKEAATDGSGRPDEPAAQKTSEGAGAAGVTPV